MADARLEAQVGDVLKDKGWTVCAAESCTGGLVMHRLTNIPGSSDYVLGGVVSYANSAKQHILHVRQGTLIAYGAVSEQVASEMAIGAREIFGATFSVSITGIAGPGGGSVDKPVGLTYIGLAGPDDLLVVQRHIWQGDREAVKAASAEATLKLLLDMLQSSRLSVGTK